MHSEEPQTCQVLPEQRIVYEIKTDWINKPDQIVGIGFGLHGFMRGYTLGIIHLEHKVTQVFELSLWTQHTWSVRHYPGQDVCSAC